MARQLTAVERLYHEVKQDLSQHETNGVPERLTGTFQKVFSLIHSLTAKQSPEQFARAWLLQTVVNEWLRYTIEDDYADLRGDARKRAAHSLLALLRRSDWVDPDLVTFLAACQSMATTHQLRPQRALLRSDRIEAFFRIANAGQPDIPVSSRSYPGVPILEDSVTDPTYVGRIVDAFADRLGRLKQKGEITCMCFIEKAAGPVGALGMMSALVRELDLPASVYRASYWAKRPKLVGYQPRPTDRIALVYDLLVTGDGVRDAAADLKETYSVTTTAAVVLLSYETSRELQTESGQVIKVEALEGYDTFAEEIGRIASGNPSSAHTERFDLSDRRAKATPARGRRNSGPPPTEGGLIVKRDPINWKPHLDSYRELAALTFPTEKEINKGIDLLWTEELLDMPHDLAGGDSIIVPVEAVRFFREAGLNFEQGKILSLDSLPADEVNTLRKQGPY